MAKKIVSPEEIGVGDNLLLSQKGIIQPLNLHRINKALNDINAPPFTHPWYDMTMEEIIASEATGTRLEFLYGLFDKLVAKDTTYGSRRVFEADAWGNEVVEYTFSSPAIQRGPWLKVENTAPPRILVIGGQHGQELNSILTFYLFMLDILDHWEKDAFYMQMYTAVEFKILLCATPSAVKLNNKTNSNGVDVGRNFAVDWVKSGVLYGAAAMSERDTQNIVKWLESYSKQNIGCIELHDHNADQSIICSSHHPMHQRIVLRALRNYNEWVYESPLARGTLPSRQVRGRGLSVYEKAANGSLAKHATILLKQPTISIEHAYANHIQLGSGMYWQRVTFRLMLRCVVKELLDHNSNYDFYDALL